MAETDMNHILESMGWMKKCLKDVCDDIRVIELDLFALKEDCKRREEERKALDKHVIETLHNLCQYITGKEGVEMSEKILGDKMEKESDKKEFGMKNGSPIGSAEIGLKTKIVNDIGGCSNKEGGLFEDMLGGSKNEWMNVMDTDGSEKLIQNDSTTKLVTPNTAPTENVCYEANTSSTGCLPHLFKVTRDGTLSSIKKSEDSVYIKSCEKLKRKCSYANISSENEIEVPFSGISQMENENVKQRSDRGDNEKTMKFDNGIPPKCLEKSIYEQKIEGIPFDGVYTCGPFKFSRPLKRLKYVAVIEYIFDATLNQLEEIVETERSYLTRSAMLCLRPQKCLIDEVININSEILTKAERTRTSNKAQNWYLTTRMTSASMGVGSNPQEFMKRHNFRKHSMGKLGDCDNIFIPIHCSKHWLMFLFRVKEELVEIWDSFLFDGESIGQSLVRDVMVNLDQILEDDIRTSKPAGWSFKNFKIVTQVHVPQQQNGTDCGIYVINFMEQQSTSHILQINSNNHEERASIVLKLVMSVINKEKNNLSDRAIQYYMKKYGIEDPSRSTDLHKRRFS